MTDDVRDESRGVLAFLDEDGTELVLDAAEATDLLALTGDLEDATISACPECRSRVLACLALVDVLDRSGPHPRAEELVEFADDAPSSHCYVDDRAAMCRHVHWLDPGRSEWAEVVFRGDAPTLRPRG